MKSRLVNHLSVAMAITLSHFAIDSIKNYAFAQISEDSTLSTTVDTTDFLNFVIENGDRIGDNLFHSFLEFSVPTNGSAFFDNANDIANIFSRVTGGSISEIDGLIRANGAANLFLLNPAGIVFGPNASLDIGGSFLATTADSFVFADGVEFSATNPQAPPLLEVNIPIGLRFRDNPGDIAVNNSNLAVNQGQNLSLLGGNVASQSSNLSAPGGRIEIGGLAVAGTVDLNPDFSFVFPEGVAQGDVSLTETSTVSVVSDGSGEIRVNAQNLSITEGSSLNAGIAANADINDAQAGDITVNIIDTFFLDGTDETGEIDSGIFSEVGSGASGVSGNITVNANTLNLSNNARIQSDIANNAISNPNNRSGDININANEVNITNDVAIFNRVGSNSQGQSGDINIQTGSLNLLDSSIRTVVRNSAEGNGGDININADSIVLESSEILPEYDKIILIQTRIAGRGAMGDAGDININADSFELIGGAVESRIASDSQGNAGDINIDAESINLNEGLIISRISNDGQGSSGDINFNANSVVSRNTIIESSLGDNVSATDSTNSTGNITINTGETGFVRMEADGSQSRIEVVVGVDSQGNVGNITINTGLLSVNGISTSEVSRSLIRSRLDTRATASNNDGSINLNANEVELLNSAYIVSSMRGGVQGDAGLININTGSLYLDGSEARIRSIVDNPDSNIATQGSGGDVFIQANSIKLFNGANIRLTVRPEGEAPAGSITIFTNSLELIDGSRIVTRTNGSGSAGEIEINATDYILVSGNNGFRIQDNGGQLVVQTSRIQNTTVNNDDGQAGSIKIDTGNLQVSNGAFISAGTSSSSDAGNITIDAENLEVIDGGQIISNTARAGNAGDLKFNVSESIIVEGTDPNRDRIIQEIIAEVEENIDNFPEGTNPEVVAERAFATLTGQSAILARGRENSTGNSGNINIDPVDVIVRDGAEISVSNLGTGAAGTINLTTENLLVDNAQVTATASGTAGGNINLIDLESTIIRNEGVISANNLGTGEGGTIDLTTNNLELDNGQITATTSGSTGGNINLIDLESAIIRNEGLISANNLGTGQGGTIDLTTDNLELDNGQITATTSGSAIGGNINLNVSDLLLLRNRSEISAANLNQDSVALEGNIDINTNLLVLLEGSSIITSDFAPDGGSNIGISASGIFVSSDSLINATGDLTIDTDIELEPTELPEVKVVDDGDQVSQNACYQGQGSQFANTGRGGVPTNVTESLNSDTVRVDLVEPVASSTSNASIDPSLPLDDEGKPIIPAQGWIFTEDGKVLLTAYDPAEVQRSASIKNNCVGR